MPRVKRSANSRKRHKRVLKMAKGYQFSHRRRFRVANEMVMKALQHAYRHRRTRKRDFRKLWIARINAAARTNGMSYNRFINGLKRAGVDVNRKMLAQLAVNDEQAFSRLVEVAREQLDS